MSTLTGTAPRAAVVAAPATPVRTTDGMLAGARAMAPMMVAFLPFGLVVGAAVASSDNTAAAWLATWTIYGGAAHLAVLDVLAQGSGWVVAAAVGLLVNVRLTAYAAAMAPQWRGAPLRHRWAAAVMLTDATWALSRARTHDYRRFYFGAALTLFVCWPVLVMAGALVGDQVSSSPTAHLLPGLSLGALVMAQLGERPAAAAVAAAAMSGVVTTSLDAGLALVIAAATGLLTATLVQVRS